MKKRYRGMQPFDFFLRLNIVERQMEDKEKIFKQWYEQYASFMLGVCLRYSSNQEEAKDIFQEGFINVYQSIDNFKGKSKVKTWITKIMINTAITFYRKKNILDTVDYYDVEELATNGFYSWGKIDVIAKMNEEELLEIVNELAPSARMIFNMSVIEGYNHKEISRMLGISEGTSKSQLSRAKDRLKTLLKQKAFVPGFNL